MCGIAGIAGNNIDQALVAQMTAIIAHRGPDDSGCYCSPDGLVGLGNRRLAIIDLSSAGHMPMNIANGRFWITYNGEIYNFPQLRAWLEQKGYTFASHTDTEVILTLYQHEGISAFRRLNGMFALAIWDTDKQELILARDRFGVKPLYYSAVAGQLLFGSEIKSLLLHPQLIPALNPEALHEYLTHLWVPAPNTLFQNIHKLHPGHYLSWQNGRFHTQPYWQIQWPDGTNNYQANFDHWHGQLPTTEQAWIEEMQAVLRRAVQRHLIADVPVGLFLSGGLDSSTLLAYMHQLMQTPIKAYTIAFRQEDTRLEQSGGADAHYAEQIANHFGAQFHRIEVDPDIVNLLPKVIWHLDEPIADPAAINTMLISQAARPDVTVLLSGQGADELMAGYRVHLAEHFARRLFWLPGPARRHLLKPALGLLPGAANWLPNQQAGWLLAFHRYFNKLADSLELTPEERYLFNRSYYTQAQLLSLYRPECRPHFAGFDGSQRHKSYFAELPTANFVNRMIHVDLKTFLPGLNLVYGDKLSMAASVEVRVPFLDYELTELMTAVPPSLKLHGSTGKYLLRQAMKGILPDSILTRRKVGFGAPIRRWLMHDLAPMMDDLLSPATLKSRGYFDETAVLRMIADHRQGRADHTYRLWALLTLELWLRLFVDANR